MSLLSPLNQRDFRWLFLGQAISLLGTGLASVALALQAYALKPTSAGALLGTVLAIKMVVYLTVAPVVGGYAQHLPRRGWLVGLNLARALVVLTMPLATQPWQLMLLIAVLNALAAGYTPVYQALLPDVVTDDQEYTRALSLSRLTLELENLLSPTLAALLLLTVSWPVLFQLNSLAFVLSVGLLLLASIPPAAPVEPRGGVWQQVSFGVRSFLAAPQLRAVLALHLVVALAGAMVIVNSVVFVRGVLALGEAHVATLIAASGLGAMLSAWLLPRLVDRFGDRRVMLAGGLLLSLALVLGLLEPGYLALFPLWFLIGAATSLVLIPVGRVLRDVCPAADRNDYFAANFALSHGMWLVGYLLAGWTGSALGMMGSFAVLALVASLASLLAWWLWSRQPKSLDKEVLEP